LCLAPFTLGACAAAVPPAFSPRASFHSCAAASGAPAVCVHLQIAAPLSGLPPPLLPGQERLLTYLPFCHLPPACVYCYLPAFVWITWNVSEPAVTWIYCRSAFCCRFRLDYCRVLRSCRRHAFVLPATCLPLRSPPACLHGCAAFWVQITCTCRFAAFSVARICHVLPPAGRCFCLRCHLFLPPPAVCWVCCLFLPPAGFCRCLIPLCRFVLFTCVFCFSGLPAACLPPAARLLPGFPACLILQFSLCLRLPLTLPFSPGSAIYRRLPACCRCTNRFVLLPAFSFGTPFSLWFRTYLPLRLAACSFISACLDVLPALHAVHRSPFGFAVSAVLLLYRSLLHWFSRRLCCLDGCMPAAVLPRNTSWPAVPDTCAPAPTLLLLLLFLHFAFLGLDFMIPSFACHLRLPFCLLCVSRSGFCLPAASRFAVLYTVSCSRSSCHLHLDAFMPLCIFVLRFYCCSTVSAVPASFTCRFCLRRSPFCLLRMDASYVLRTRALRGNAHAATGQRMPHWTPPAFSFSLRSVLLRSAPAPLPAYRRACTRCTYLHLCVLPALPFCRLPPFWFGHRHARLDYTAFCWFPAAFRSGSTLLLPPPLPPLPFSWVSFLQFCVLLRSLRFLRACLALRLPRVSLRAALLIRARFRSKIVPAFCLLPGFLCRYLLCLPACHWIFTAFAFSGFSVSGCLPLHRSAGYLPAVTFACTCRFACLLPAAAVLPPAYTAACLPLPLAACWVFCSRLGHYRAFCSAVLVCFVLDTFWILPPPFYLLLCCLRTCAVACRWNLPALLPRLLPPVLLPGWVLPSACCRIACCLPLLRLLPAAATPRLCAFCRTVFFFFCCLPGFASAATLLLPACWFASISATLLRTAAAYPACRLSNACLARRAATSGGWNSTYCLPACVGYLPLLPF